MSLWTFYCYLSEFGYDEIDEWYKVQSAEVQAAFDTALKFLSAQPPDKWMRPFFSVLSKECAGLGEIRFKADKVQQRPLGFFGPERMQFTLVMCATEKGGKFVPKDACKTALKRKNMIERDKERAHECKFSF